jgi:hypothetical protein
MNASSRAKLVSFVLGALLLAAAAVVWAKWPTLSKPITWQRQVIPGHLSDSHRFLENNCASCHTPVKGVEVGKCVVCHANNESLLQRQPTAFHASIGSCRECHTEHQGETANLRRMNHGALAKIGLREPEHSTSADASRNNLIAWLKDRSVDSTTDRGASGLSAHEALLNCASCHSNQDRHFKLFGQNCSQCHTADKWTIPEFRHPSASSTDCAQCHQAPPSHYMEHFQMVSVVVAERPHANVSQCQLCHQTTSWNDIKGVGWYKHH